MSEELNQAVPDASAPEAVPPVRALDSGDPELLQRKLELIQQDNKTKGETNKALKKQLEDMQQRLQELQQGHQKQKQDNLVRNQEFEQLWKDASQSNSTLQEQLAEKDRAIEEMKVQFQQEQIRASATNLFAQSGVNAPDHLMKILGDSLRLDENGSVVCLSGGVQVPLNQHIQNLRTPGSGFEMFFSGTQARGMSAVGSTTNSTGGKAWSSMSFTEQIAMLDSDPEGAARLKAQG